MISVIIPTCNRNELLGKCLDQLAPSIVSVHANCEVIVTDDSKENVAQQFIQIKYPWVVWTAGPKKGPAANRNNGANHAKGEWLVFIDDDCLPDRNLLTEYEKAIKDNLGCLAFEGAILPDKWELLKKDMAECPVNTDGGCFWSANICIEKNLFEQIGGFNEQFFIAAQEDQQLKIDVQIKMEQRIVFIKEAKVIHPVRFMNFRSKFCNIPRTSRNFSFYAYKNRKALGYQSLLIFFKRELITHIRQSYFYLKNGMNKSFMIEIAWLLWGIPLNLFNYISFKFKKI